MILLVDAGNTRIKWRLVADDAVQAVLDEGALGHDGIDTIGRLRERHRGPLRVVGSNVAGTAVAKRITAALGVDAVEWLRPAPQACGVRNLYDHRSSSAPTAGPRSSVRVTRMRRRASW